MRISGCQRKPENHQYEVGILIENLVSVRVLPRCDAGTVDRRPRYRRGCGYHAEQALDCSSRKKSLASAPHDPQSRSGGEGDRIGKQSVRHPPTAINSLASTRSPRLSGFPGPPHIAAHEWRCQSRSFRILFQLDYACANPMAACPLHVARIIQVRAKFSQSERLVGPRPCTRALASQNLRSGHGKARSRCMWKQEPHPSR